MGSELFIKFVVEEVRVNFGINCFFQNFREEWQIEQRLLKLLGPESVLLQQI